MSQGTGGGKGFGSRLRGLMFEDDSSQTSQPTPVSPSEPHRPNPTFGSIAPRVPSTPSSFDASVSMNGVDPALLADVEQALSKRNPPAYLQFTGVLSSLAAKIADEGTRFTAAAAVAPNLNIDLATVRSAYEERVRIVGSLREAFEEQSKTELDKRVSVAEREVKGIDTEIQRVQAEIARLTAQAEGLVRDRAARSASIAADRENIASVRQGMLAAFAVVEAKVTNERDNASRLITGG